MQRYFLSKKFTFFLLVFILLFDSFFGATAVGQGSQQNTNNDTKIKTPYFIPEGGHLPSPSPMPSTSMLALEPTLLLEVTPTPTPTPTPMPDISMIALFTEENKFIQSKLNVDTLEDKPSEGYNVMLEPDVKALFQKYTELLNDNQVNLDLKLIQQLIDLGASIPDIYSIALLHEMYDEDSIHLWNLKETSGDTWLELEQKFSQETKHLIPIRVTEEVYKQEEQAITFSRPIVTDAVYEELPLVSSDQPIVMYSALATLNRSLNDAMGELGLKDKYQTFNQQFYDQNDSTESIDPITGMLTWRSNQISLPGRDGLDLNIGVVYQSNVASEFYPATMYEASEGRSINAGYRDPNIRNNYLGLGWTFNVPSIKGDYYNDGKGGNYEIIYTSSKDGSDPYYTLKDYPTGDVRIVPSYSGRSIVFPDKSRESFQPDKLIKTDRFGNTITYTYNSDGNISRIDDTLGRIIVFEYKTYQYGFPSTEPNVRVKIFENGVQAREVRYYQQSLGFNGATGLKRIEVTDDEKIQFEYADYKNEYDFFGKSLPSNRANGHSEYMLKKVQYNNTSQTVYDYEYGIHNLSIYGVIKKSRVCGRSDIILRDSQPSYVMNHSVYTYSGDYSGYGITNDPEKLPAGYHFSRSSTLLDKYNVSQQTTITTFNHLKQQETVDSKIVSGNQAGQRVLTMYSNFLSNYTFTPTLIEQREYENDADPNPNILYTELTYDPMGYLLTETLPLSSERRNNAAIKQKYTISYQYDPNFRLLSTKSWYQNETDVSPLIETVAYTVDGRIERNTNAAGEVTYYSYVKDNGAFTATAEKWKGSKLVSKTATVYGSEYEFAYPTLKQQYFNINKTDQKIISVAMEYNKATGRLIKSTDGNKQSTMYDYDAGGRLKKEIYPIRTNSNGETFSEVVDYNYYYQTSPNFDSVNTGTVVLKVDSIKTVQLSSGSTMRTYANVLYNGMGLALLEEHYDDNVGNWVFTQYHYDDQGRPIYQKDALGNEIKVSYDAWGRQSRATDAHNNLYVTDYNLKQRKTESYMVDAETQERLNYLETIYDPWGRPVTMKTYKDWPSQSQPLTERYQYDISGNVIGYTDPENHLNDAGTTTSYSYDVLNRLSSVYDALSQRTRYTYDGNGQLAKVTVQAKGGTEQTLHTKSYNEVGLLSSKLDGASQSETLTYNALGQLSSKTDRNGSVFNYSYDEMGGLKSSTVNGTINNVAQTQKTEQFYNDGSPSYQTTKNYLNGTIQAMQRNTVNSMNQVRSKNTVAYSAGAATHTAYIYNQRDALSRITQLNDYYLNFYVNYTFNKLRLDKVQTNGSATVNSAPTANVQYSYTGNNLVKTITYPALTDGSLLKTVYTYNKALNWVESVTNQKGSSVLSKYVYGYDKNGNITSIAETNRSGVTQTTTYGYDALNRLNLTVRPGGSRDVYTYDVRGNRLTMEQSVSSPVDFQDTTYSYDLWNTLTSVTKNGSTTSFRYYADGLRYLKSTGSAHTQVNYDFNGQVITEEKLNGNNIVQKSTYVRGDRILMKKDKTASKDYYYLYNGHGDVVQIVDTSGKTVNEYSYDEWGNITSQTEEISTGEKWLC